MSRCQLKLHMINIQLLINPPSLTQLNIAIVLPVTQFINEHLQLNLLFWPILYRLHNLSEFLCSHCLNFLLGSNHLLSCFAKSSPLAVIVAILPS